VSACFGNWHCEGWDCECVTADEVLYCMALVKSMVYACIQRFDGAWMV
jgi:hypothetical protein